MKVRPETRARLAAGALVLVAIAPPHFLAGALGWSVPLIVALCGGALALLAGFSAAPPRVRLDGVLFGLWLFTLLQLVPLPTSWVGWLSPARLEALATRELAGASTGFLPLSLDPGRTFEQVVVGLGILAAYAVGRTYASERGRRGVIVAAAISTVIVAVIGFTHELVGAEAVYGWHTPQETSPQLLSPLLNTNHFGGFAAFGAALCLGLAAKRRRAVDLRWAWILGGVVCGAAAIVAASRGAVLSLALGLGLAGAALIRREKGSSRRREGRGAVLVGAAGIAALAAYLGLEQTFRDFEQGDYSKLDLAEASLPLVAEMPWLGIGRGAFAPVFVAIDADGSAWTTTPENLVVLWLVEWGVIATVVALGALVPAVWRAWRSEHREVAAAAGALAAWVVHDLVDFSMEMPGLVVVAALLLGALVTPRRDASHEGDRRSRRAEERTTTRSPMKRERMVLAGLAALSTLVPLATWSMLVAQRPEHRREQLLAATTLDQLDTTVREVAVEHPLDPALAAYVAHAYERLDVARALPWVNRAMQLAPSWSAPHVAAARVLARMRAFRQSLLEVREAENRRPGSATEIACALAPRVDDATLLELAPDDVDGYLLRVSRCVPADRLATLDSAFLDTGAESAAVHGRAARRARAAGDLEGALRHAERARALAPEDASSLVVLAEVRAATDGAAAGLELLGSGPAPAEVLRTRARLASQVGDEASFERDLSRLRALAAGRPAALATEWAFAARLEESRGNDGAALVAAERAHQLQPRNDAHLAQVARAAKRAGQLRRAHTANTELCRRGSTAACQALEPTNLSRQRTDLGGAAAGETP